MVTGAMHVDPVALVVGGTTLSVAGAVDGPAVPGVCLLTDLLDL